MPIAKAVGASSAIPILFQPVLLHNLLWNLWVRKASVASAGVTKASGNESNRPQFEIAVAPPAAGTDIIAVGAGLSIARFSNTQVNCVVPGVNVLSAALGAGLKPLNGTSMATPHCAGVAVLWAQRMLEATGRVDSQHLMARLIGSETRTPLVTDADAEDVGAGLVQAPLN